MGNLRSTAGLYGTGEVHRLFCPWLHACACGGFAVPATASYAGAKKPSQSIVRIHRFLNTPFLSSYPPPGRSKQGEPQTMIILKIVFFILHPVAFVSSRFRNRQPNPKYID